jgi:chemotaxis protein MotB
MSESSGHGSSWIITYSDMITLLMACFIMVITFASREPERFGVKKDSPFAGTGGTGAIGAWNEGRDRDTIVWRESPPLGRLGKGGSEMPPLYADPALRGTADVLRHLEDISGGTLKDSYSLQLPLALLFESKTRLSSSGTQLLHAIAQRVRYLPYDVQFEIDDAQNIPRAVLLAEYMAHEESVHPSRLAAGVRQATQPWHASVWVVLARHPGGPTPWH